MAGEIEVQVKDKFCLTIDEASEYFNIGEKKMRKLVAENMDSGFVIQNGVKVLIKRKRFEAFLDDLSAIRMCPLPYTAPVASHRAFFFKVLPAARSRGKKQGKG